MDVSTMAAFFMNSSNITTTVATMSMIAPTSIPSTTTLTMPFIVTSMSHRTLQNLNKAGGGTKFYIKDFSPVTLSTEWSKMARLLVLACLSVIGSIGNVFMISSVMIEDHLKKAGKCSHLNLCTYKFRWVGEKEEGGWEGGELAITFRPAQALSFISFIVHEFYSNFTHTFSISKMNEFLSSSIKNFII